MSNDPHRRHSFCCNTFLLLCFDTGAGNATCFQSSPAFVYETARAKKHAHQSPLLPIICNRLEVNNLSRTPLIWCLDSTGKSLLLPCIILALLHLPFSSPMFESFQSFPLQRIGKNKRKRRMIPPSPSTHFPPLSDMRKIFRYMHLSLLCCRLVGL